MNNDYLMHHGIKGMRWGLRRFQNKDGSLTSAGRTRYGGDFDRKSFNMKSYAAKLENNIKRGRPLSKKDLKDPKVRRELRDLNKISNMEDSPKERRALQKGGGHFWPTEARKAEKQNRRQMERQAYDKWMSGKKLSDDEKRVLIGKKNPSEKALARFDKYTSGKIHQKTVNDYNKSKQKKRELTPEEKQARKEKLVRGAKTAAKVLGTAAVIGGSAYAFKKIADARTKKLLSQPETDLERRLREKANGLADRQRQQMMQQRRTTNSPDHTSGAFTGSSARATAMNQYNIPRTIRTTSAHNRHDTSGYANSSDEWSSRADNIRAIRSNVRTARNANSGRTGNARGSDAGRRVLDTLTTSSPLNSTSTTATRSNDSVRRANARAAANTERARAALDEHMRRTGSRRR